MTYHDSNGNVWGTAEDALADFMADLPALTEEEQELVFQFTRHSDTAETNLAAIEAGITEAGLDARFAGDNYPVPTRTPEP